MKLNIFSVLLGAISLVAMPLTTQVQAEEQICPDEFDGLELSDLQQEQLQGLEEQFDDRFDEIMPLSPESEARVEQLEEAFERQVIALLSTEQEQQIAKLDAWANNQVAGIAPVLLDSDTEEVVLTGEQEAALEIVEEEYEQTFNSLLTPEQQQQFDAFEEQIEAEIDALQPQASAEAETSIEAAEDEFEQGMMQILTDEQLQQLASNLEACEASES